MRLIIIVSLLAIPSVWANAPERVGAVEIDRSDRYLMPSSAVGDKFRIDVILPIGYEATAAERYPVVYVTDANYLVYSAIATYLAQATNEFQKLIIVGVGWDVPSITRIRVRDFSPSCDAQYQKTNELADHECGGADKFTGFLQDELQPFIDKNYRTTKDNTLVGYSFGGLFATHVLFNHTDAFDRYLIGSPSIRWDNEISFDSEANYAKRHDDLDKHVYISVGGLEGFSTIPNAYRLYEQLLAREYPNLKIELEVLPGETHMTSIAPFVMRGLRTVGFAK